MMKRFTFLTLLLCTLASSAGALKMSIWDREMQTTVGAGESSGSKFNVQLIRDFSGPVVVLFSQTDEEKKSGAFNGLQNRYDGVLKNGQLSIMSRPEAAPAPVVVGGTGRPNQPAQSSTAPTGNSGASGAAITLGKLLQPFKLNVDIKVTGENNAPENAPRNADDKEVTTAPVVTTPKTNSAGGNGPQR